MKLKLKIVLACCVLMAGCSRACDGGGNNNNGNVGTATPSPGGDDIVNQVPGRDLREDPPAVESVVVRPLPSPTAEGNAVVLVQFAREERLPQQLTVDLENGRLTLHDDGKNGDERAQDSLFSAVTNLDLNELRRQREQQFTRAQDGTTPVFVNRRLVSEERVASLRERFIRADLIDLTPFGLPQTIDSERSLMIRDPAVVQDPSRTRTACTGAGSSSMGKWSFGYLMEQMANQPASGVSPSDFTMKWLEKWKANQTINGWTVAARVNVQADIIDPWVAASGGPGKPLDLSKAPFRLLAIVNRVDLRQNLVYGGGSAGEGRFVFSLVKGPNCQASPFLVIFEYGVPKSGCKAVRDWGQQWKNLDAHPVGSPAYNAALEAITEQFAKAGANPSKPNGSALNQLRTNEIELANPWELREFQITKGGGGHLEEVTVKQTPDITLNKTATLVSYVDMNAAQIIAQKHNVPEEFPAGSGQRFLGGSALTDFGVFWDDPTAPPPIANREARHMFSLQTCNGCHAGETNTVFTHVKEAPFGSNVNLSGFLTGITVNDPSDGSPTRNFNDLLRRKEDLDALISSPCLGLIKRPRLRMVH
jgi:hypothetical protein